MEPAARNGDAPGHDPVKSVKYQAMVMFMRAAATSLGCVIIATLAYRCLFNAKHQFAGELIVKRKG